MSSSAGGADDDPREGLRVGSILWERLGSDVGVEPDLEGATDAPPVAAGPGGPERPRRAETAESEPVASGVPPDADFDGDDEVLGDVEILDQDDDDDDDDQDEGDEGDASDASDASEWSAEDEAVLEAEEAISADIAKLTSERDDYLEQLRRLSADFENYRKRVLRQQTEHLERAAEGLVEKLLDVLDTFEAAVAHGEGFDQVRGTLVGVLEKEGLERIDPEGEPFDPLEADAVAHEEGEGGPVVAKVLRPGYRWKGRVLRPAMVTVRG